MCPDVEESEQVVESCQVKVKIQMKRSKKIGVGNVKQRASSKCLELVFIPWMTYSGFAAESKIYMEM